MVQIRQSLAFRPASALVCLLALVALGVILGCSEGSKTPGPDLPKPDPHSALENAVAFLVGQQASDGNWYAEKYGKFKQVNGSVAPTALVLYALAHLPDDLRKPHEPIMRTALSRLRSLITARGFIGDVHGAAHYPTYTTSMVLSTYDRLGWELPIEDRKAMINYLDSAQLAKSRGWTFDDGNFGGWDLFGDQHVERDPRGPGTSISVTCFALEALAPYIPGPEQESETTSDLTVPSSTQFLAALWLSRVQDNSTGGGFGFGPDPPANKAGLVAQKGREEESGDSAKNTDAPKLHSYGSATCDGLRSLSYLQLRSDDQQRVKAAELWLVRNDVIDSVPGFQGPTDRNWQQALYYYYTMSLAKAYRLYPETGTMTRRGLLADQLVKLQQKDGSWVNTASGNTEDDPLIATAFAIIAISEATAKQ